MIKFDSHIHTQLCGHAKTMTIPALVEQADKLGLSSALIAEHIFAPEDIAQLDNIQKQINAIDHDCNIIVGAEVDVNAKLFDGTFVATNKQLENTPLILAAVHYIPGVGSYPHGPEDNPLSPEELLTKWRSTLLGLLENPIVDMLAHPGRLPGSTLDLNIYFDDIIAVLTEAARISAKNNIVWEINNLTCARIKKEFVSQWHRTIAPAIEAGVKITFGSDAHTPQDIATQGYVQQILNNLKYQPKLLTPAEILKNKNAK